MNSNVQINSIVNTSYEDLGQIITATNVAAGATVYSNWFDNVQWVRNIAILSYSDQTYDLGITRKDTGLQSSADGTLLSSLQANAWIFRAVIPQNGTNACSLLGYSAKFFIKNSSASANTFANLRVQLMGL